MKKKGELAIGLTVVLSMTKWSLVKPSKELIASSVSWPRVVCFVMTHRSASPTFCKSHVQKLNILLLSFSAVMVYCHKGGVCYVSML